MDYGRRVSAAEFFGKETDSPFRADTAGCRPADAAPERTGPAGAPRAAAGGRGRCLSKAHTTTEVRRGLKNIDVSSRIVKFTNPAVVYGSSGGGGPRGVVGGFSRASRRRLMRLLSQWSFGLFQECLVAALHLTYPAEYPEARVSKADLEEFRRRLLKEYDGKVFGAWKIEPQERGAPHYHLLLAFPGGRGWGPREFWDFHQWVANTWYEVVGSGDERHLRVHLYDDDPEKAAVQQVRSYRSFAGYLSKYVGKVVDSVTWREPGRWWGRINPELMESWLQVIQYQVDWSVWKWVRRVLRKRAPAAVRRSRISGGDGTWWTWDRTDEEGRPSSSLVRQLVEFYGGPAGVEGPVGVGLKLG